MRASGGDTISRVTAGVLDDAREWQQRPLDSVYPIVYLDALILKIRDGKSVVNNACYLAIGVNLSGERDVLGIWFAQTEGAKFWLAVLTEIKARGVDDVLVCCADGLNGFAEAIEAVYPKTWVQTCIVHQVRSSLRYVSYRDRKAVASDLKKIYTAIDRDAAETELEAFAEKWDDRYAMISASWIANFERIVPFLAFPADLRRVVYTTNTIEACNRQIRKHVKTRGSFPTEDAARKLLYLTINNARPNWRSTYNWSAALAAFKIHFGDRLPDRNPTSITGPTRPLHLPSHQPPTQTNGRPPTVARELLADLVERGPDCEQGVLVVLDGGKALRAAVRHVLGDVPVQRCVRHKERNVLDHLPERDRAGVKRRLRAAWKLTDTPWSASRRSPASWRTPTPERPRRCARASPRRSRCSASASTSSSGAPCPRRTRSSR